MNNENALSEAHLRGLAVQLVTYRTSTGVVLAGSRWLDHEAALAASAGIGHVDFVAMALNDTPDGESVVPMGKDKEQGRLCRAIASGPFSTVLISRFDIVLARLSANDRNVLWSWVLQWWQTGDRQAIIVMPQKAVELFPSSSLISSLRDQGRWSPID